MLTNIYLAFDNAVWAHYVRQEPAENQVNPHGQADAGG